MYHTLNFLCENQLYCRDIWRKILFLYGKSSIGIYEYYNLNNNTILIQNEYYYTEDKSFDNVTTVEF